MTKTAHLTAPLARILRGSTALGLALALALPANLAAHAQTADSVTPPAVDCASDGSNPACAPLPPPVVEDPIVEEQPLVEEPVLEAPVVEEPAPAPEPQPVEQPVEQPPVEETPAPDAPVVEAPVVETPAPEAPAPEAPAAEEPAVDEPAVEEPPVEEPAVEETAPAPEAGTEQTPQAQTVEPSSELPPVVQEPAAAPTEAPAADTPAMEPAAQAAPAPEPEPLPEVTPVTVEAVLLNSEEPATIIPDVVTQEQSVQIQQQELRRREDARERRNELLGAAAVGAAIGLLIPALGGTVVEDQGDRLIVERDGEYFVRRDESGLLRDGDVEVRIERLRNGRTQETITRRNGVEIITVRDQGGFILYRSRVLPNGQEIVLIDNLDYDERVFVDYDTLLPPLRPGLPLELYIVPARQAGYQGIYQTFSAPPVQPVEQGYSLRQVRESERLRAMVRRVDLDTITFDSGQATVRQSQVPLLEDIARASIALIDEEPETLLLVEGHTDAVGSDISNLALSDRRAETVARILSEVYGVQPENMVVQGYGEQFLKIPTQGDEERNRRVTIRNISPLLSRN